MIELEENLRFLNELKIKLNQIKDSMKIDSLKKQLKELEEESTKDGFWNDQENSSKVFAKIKSLQRKLNSYEKDNSNYFMLCYSNYVYINWKIL